MSKSNSEIPSILDQTYVFLKHATLTIETSPGVFQTVYCHRQGCPEKTGKLLLRFFTTPKALDQILTSEGIFMIADDGFIEPYRLPMPNEINTCRQDAFNCWDVDYHYLHMGGQWWFMLSEDDLISLDEHLQPIKRIRKKRVRPSSLDERVALN